MDVVCDAGKATMNSFLPGTMVTLKAAFARATLFAKRPSAAHLTNRHMKADEVALVIVEEQVESTVNGKARTEAVVLVLVGSRVGWVWASLLREAL